MITNYAILLRILLIFDQIIKSLYLNLGEKKKNKHTHRDTYILIIRILMEHDHYNQNSIYLIIQYQIIMLLHFVSLTDST